MPTRLAVRVTSSPSVALVVMLASGVTACVHGAPPPSAAPRPIAATSTASARVQGAEPPVTTTAGGGARDEAAPPGLDPGWTGLVPPGDEICEKNSDGTYKDAIAAGTYTGLLRGAKCDQQRFLTMAYLMKAVGASDCNHCHAEDPKDPKKYDYPAWTDNKRTARWMSATFIAGLKFSAEHGSLAEGGRVACKSCHVDPEGHAKLRILGAPRDAALAQEWMHDVMTTKFVEANGDRLRCKTCHVGLGPGQAAWERSVKERLVFGSSGLERPASPSR